MNTGYQHSVTAAEGPERGIWPRHRAHFTERGRPLFPVRARSAGDSPAWSRLATTQAITVETGGSRFLESAATRSGNRHPSLRLSGSQGA